MIAVLPPDCPEALLDDLRREAQERGWRCEASRGEEQTVLAVGGAASTDELERWLAGRTEADVVELPSARRFRAASRRRRTNLWLVGGLTALVALGILLPVLGFLKARHETGGWRDLVRVAAAGDVAPDAAELVHAGDERVLVVRLGENRLFALQATCTYVDGCRLRWSPERHQLVCPCDGGAFDVYGAVVQGPPFRPLRSWPIQRIGDDLYVRVR